MLKVNNLVASSDSSVSHSSHGSNNPGARPAFPTYSVHLESATAVGSLTGSATTATRSKAPFLVATRALLHPLSPRHLLSPGHWRKSPALCRGPPGPSSPRPLTSSLIFYTPTSLPVAALLVLPDWKAPPPEICTEILVQTILSKTVPSRLPRTPAPCCSVQPSPQAPCTELSTTGVSGYYNVIILHILGHITIYP